VRKNEKLMRNLAQAAHREHYHSRWEERSERDQQEYRRLAEAFCTALERPEIVEALTREVYSQMEIQQHGALGVVVKQNGDRSQVELAELRRRLSIEGMMYALLSHGHHPRWPQE